MQGVSDKAEPARLEETGEGGPEMTALLQNWAEGLGLGSSDRDETQSSDRSPEPSPELSKAVLCPLTSRAAS